MEINVVVQKISISELPQPFTVNCLHFVIIVFIVSVECFASIRLQESQLSSGTSHVHLFIHNIYI